MSTHVQDLMSKYLEHVSRRHTLEAVLGVVVQAAAWRRLHCHVPTSQQTKEDLQQSQMNRITTSAALQASSVPFLACFFVWYLFDFLSAPFSM